VEKQFRESDELGLSTSVYSINTAISVRRSAVCGRSDMKTDSRVNCRIAPKSPSQASCFRKRPGVVGSRFSALPPQLRPQVPTPEHEFRVLHWLGRPATASGLVSPPLLFFLSSGNAQIHRCMRKKFDIPDRPIDLLGPVSGAKLVLLLGSRRFRHHFRSEHGFEPSSCWNILRQVSPPS
jgi:hypothetical protein